MTNKWLIAVGLLLAGCPAQDDAMLGTTGITPMGTDGSNKDDDSDDPDSDRPKDDEPDVDDDEDDDDPDGEACDEWSFECPDGTCLDETRYCDGTPDCSGGWDEEDCELVPACADGEFECNDGECIPFDFTCDGDLDCVGGEDEELLACPADRCGDDSYACEESQTCIPVEFICDGDEDCPEADDERDCDGGCSAGQLVCGDGTCLEAGQVCDGIAQCNGGEDELACGDGGGGCGPGTVQCLIGDQCIPASYQCDAEPDCPLGLDELLCAAGSREYFECFDGELIPLDYVCDGFFVDCAGGEDEYGCGF